MSGLEPRPERYLSELRILLLIENDASFSCVNLGRFKNLLFPDLQATVSLCI